MMNVYWFPIVRRIFSESLRAMKCELKRQGWNARLPLLGITLWRFTAVVMLSLSESWMRRKSHCCSPVSAADDCRFIDSGITDGADVNRRRIRAVNPSTPSLVGRQGHWVGSGVAPDNCAVGAKYLAWIVSQISFKNCSFEVLLPSCAPVCSKVLRK